MIIQTLFNKIQFKSIVLKNSFIYILAQIINGLIPFLLLPVLTKYLQPTDYGLISLYNTGISMLSIFMGIGIVAAIEVSFFKLSKEEFKKYIANAIFIIILSLIFILSIIYIFQDILITVWNIQPMWYYIASVVSFFQLINFINLALWRINHKAKQYAFLSIGLSLFNMLISLILILLYQYTWEGRAIGISGSIIIIGILSLFLIINRNYLMFNISLKYIKNILKFSFSLIPHRLALWVKASSDIFLISIILGVNDTGIYTLSLQFGIIISIISNGINSAYSPYLFKELRTITQNKKYNLVTFIYKYFIFMLLLSGIIGLFSIYLMPYMVEKSYHDATKYIFWISISYGIQATYTIVVNYLFFLEKNLYVSYVTIFSSVFHVLLSYLLLNFMESINGAIYASVVSSILMLTLVFILIEKFYKMPWGLNTRKCNV